MEQTLYLRAKVVLISSSETVYTEEIPFDIEVTDPCELVGTNIDQNTISDIEYWIGDGSTQLVLGTGYWDDQWSSAVWFNQANYCGLKKLELYEGD